MRYIRTKDGVYEVVDTYETKYVVGYTEDGFEKVVYKENIIAQADIIEELCDRFIFHYQKIRDNEIVDEVYKVCRFLWEAKEYYNEHKRNKEIKSAIWTDKGLIYVAKMNENGDLELI